MKLKMAKWQSSLSSINELKLNIFTTEIAASVGHFQQKYFHMYVSRPYCTLNLCQVWSKSIQSPLHRGPTLMKKEVDSIVPYETIKKLAVHSN